MNDDNMIWVYSQKLVKD